MAEKSKELITAEDKQPNTNVTLLAQYSTQFAPIVVILGTVGIFSVLLYNIQDSKLLEQITKFSSSFARGVITILFAFITTILALMLTYFVLFSDPKEHKERFGMGREILSIFVGILGTIVGFYFGSAPIDNGSIKASVTSVGQFSEAKEITTTVYLQFYDEAQREAVKLIQTKLRDSDFHVPAIENVGDDKGDKANPIKQSIVRYYNDSDKESAEKVRTILGTDFILQKGSENLKVSVGKIEVWFKTPDTGAKKDANQ
jgi:hypothetical protein